MNDPEQPARLDLGPLPSAKLIALRDGFEAQEIPYAFGGAIALYYYRDPRSTIDIDINVFVPPEQQSDTISLLESIYDFDAENAAARIARDGQTRTLWGTTYVDLFFANTEFHEGMARRARRKPFLDTKINVISPEDLLVCKMLFDRPSDWIDIEAVVRAKRVELDQGYLESALEMFVERSDARFARWHQIMRQGGEATDTSS